MPFSSYSMNTDFLLRLNLGCLANQIDVVNLVWGRCLFNSSNINPKTACFAKFLKVITQNPLKCNSVTMELYNRFFTRYIFIINTDSTKKNFVTIIGLAWYTVSTSFHILVSLFGVRARQVGEIYLLAFNLTLFVLVLQTTAKMI